MKLLIIIFSLSSFSLFAGGSKKPPPVNENACTSSSYCTYGKMPLANQGSMKLRWYLNSKTGNKVAMDPGWCGPVAGMMALYGMKEHNKNVRYNSWLKDRTEWRYGVWKSGVGFKTKFKDGGTYNSYASNHIRDLVNAATNTKSKYHSKGSYYPMDSGASIKNSIKNKKHIEYVSMCRYKVENKRTLVANINYDSKVKQRHQQVGYYEVLGKNEGCHALAINGYDGNRLIIYDPWGRAYTVNIENIFFGRESGSNVYPNPRTRVTYGRYKKRKWANFSHFVKHGGKKSSHTILTQRVQFGIYQK
ncbi:MAG: hypothetical protein DRQ88_13230 [Epsilonproteobacteria bacterium]|nr:MAG: hypothetical protein DRQ88_13230 [Campylobacterota bacterium]